VSESLLTLLDEAARALVAARGFEGRTCRFELICDADGRVVAVWPHANPPKFTRSELEELMVELSPERAAPRRH
jgi:hypothetical protein